MSTLNNNNIKILTPTGYQPFHSINKTTKGLIQVSFIDIKTLKIVKIKTTFDHPFPTFNSSGEQTAVKKISDCICSDYFKGPTGEMMQVLSLDNMNQDAEVFDIIEVENGNVFYANDVLTHNCQFLSSEALLISPTFLAAMTKRQQHIKEKADIRNVKFWDEIKQNSTYLIGVDPATGNGSDFSVITVFSFPVLNQIAEYRSNTTSTNELYNVLKNIMLQFDRKKCSVYFSIENNGVGEGLISLYEQDDKSPDNAEFISEGNKRGMTTTAKTKMRACVNFREMLERHQITINSPIVLMELKSYVRKKGSYAAMAGATDDAISACLIITRLIEEISSYEQEAFDKLYSGNMFEEWETDDGNKDVFEWESVDDVSKEDDDDSFDVLPFM